MGYLSSSTTTSTETAALSSQGMEWQAMFSQMALSQLSEGGYDMNPVEKTEYADPDAAAKYLGQVDNYQKQLDAITADLAANPPRTDRGPRYMDPRVAQQKRLQDNMFKAQDKLADIGQTTYTDYQIKKGEDIRVKDAITRYGEGSSEVVGMRAQVQQEKVSSAEDMATVNKNYLTSLKKLTSGDYSFTEAQKKQVDEYFAPIRDVINKTSDNLLTEYGNNYEMLNSKLGELATEIDNTGFKIEDALQAASLQIDKSGATLMDVVKKVNESQEAKAQFQFDLMSEQIDTSNAQQAALLGLPPGSQSEKSQALKQKADALMKIRLSLAEDTANRELGITSQTEADKKSISLARVNLAETTGSKKEGVAQMGLGLASNLASSRENLLSWKGQEELGLSKAQSNTLMNAVTGQLPQMAQAGQSALGFAQNSQAAQLGYSQQLMNPISHALDTEQQRTFQESTTTQRSSPSIFSAITSGLGMAGSLAGGFMQSGMGGGGGGGQFNPTGSGYGGGWGSGAGFNLNF